jgi:hypothetical protein
LITVVSSILEPSFKAGYSLVRGYELGIDALFVANSLVAFHDGGIPDRFGEILVLFLVL